MLNYFIKSPENKKQWDDYLLFRWEMLRKPLGMSMDSLKDDLENSSYHIIALEEDQKSIVGSGRVHFNSLEESQIRYMAISDSYRRQGVGSDIVKKLEEYAMKHGAKKMTLNAREDAIQFYASLGYIKGSPYKSDTGIPHTTMEKYLV